MDDQDVTRNKDGTPRKTSESFPIHAPEGGYPEGAGKPKRDPPVNRGLSVLPTGEELMALSLAPLTSHLDRAGATDKFIAQTIVDCMKAEKVVTATFEGQITDEKAFVDGRLRLEAATTAAKLKGHLIDRQVRDNRHQAIIYLSGINRDDPFPQDKPE
jgi:hypothetical protein